GDDHGVFNADGEAFVANVDARLDGHHPTGLDGLSRKTDVMHIEPDGMADAMHEVFLESRRIRVLLPNGPLAQQAEADQLLLDVLLGFLLPVLGQFPRLEPADLLAQNSKHRIVDLLLPAREPAAGWNRASHVR